MSNGRIDTAQIEAILEADQAAVNKYLVTAMAEMLATCRARPAQCAAARSRQWSMRRTLVTWGLASMMAVLSIVSMIVSLTGG